ncbi:helix-turn-helix transcriptional regulator [Actinomadura fulvescens]|uniref:Uncharacterized protein n=1 Tax=Actinomadura fulvescens TaxID=46160 RepID=A0ABP6BU79_9ACTN
MDDQLIPDPSQAGTAAEFVAMLRQLKEGAGRSFRELERAAKANGDSLPASSAAAALGRTTLPRRELVAVLVRACGGDDDDVANWVSHCKRLAVQQATGESESHGGQRISRGDVEPSVAPLPSDVTPHPSPAHDRLPRRLASRLLVSTIPALAVVGVLVLTLNLTGWHVAFSIGDPPGPGAEPRPSAPATRTTGATPKTHGNAIPSDTTTAPRSRRAEKTPLPADRNPRTPRPSTPPTGRTQPPPDPPSSCDSCNVAKPRKP